MNVGRFGFYAVLSMAAGLGLLLSACATEQGTSTSTGVLLPPAPPPPQYPSPPQGTVIPGTGTIAPPVITPPPVAINYPKTIQDSNAGPAVLSLYKKAQEARAAGHADQAEALLERAQRIESHNAFVWQALAGTKLELLKPDQAEQFANRSNDLARGNPYIEAGNWRLIAAARQARGDAGGAIEAQARADNIAKSLSP
jgi:tetratricopeptide (TPR) repeat protein